MLHTAMGISIIISFLFTEFLGVATGGLVSAGYIAFFMDQPVRLASTLVLSIAIFLLMKILDRLVIIYGRRRFMAAVLLSLIGAWVLERILFSSGAAVTQDIRAVGYIIPGLIANDMLKQGILKTVFAVGIAAVVIKLILIIGIL